MFAFIWCWWWSSGLLRSGECQSCYWCRPVPEAKDSWMERKECFLVPSYPWWMRGQLDTKGNLCRFTLVPNAWSGSKCQSLYYSKAEMIVQMTQSPQGLEDITEWAVIFLETWKVCGTCGWHWLSNLPWLSVSMPHTWILYCINQPFHMYKICLIKEKSCDPSLCVNFSQLSSQIENEVKHILGEK